MSIPNAVGASTIALVGLPGSGKSAIGRRLGQQLGWRFVDSDHCIEERIGCTIREFFEREGEAAFRDVEEQVLADLTSSLRQGVVATGGGSVLRAATRQHLRERTHVVYLRSSPEDLLKRLRHDTKRPLLQVADPLQRLKDLHAVRDPLYREIAHTTVDTGRPSIAMLVGTLVQQMEDAGVAPRKFGSESDPTT
ncbi:shikimate kinase [Variovorax sp. LT1P1]|uniref:shikimate kinase n=1 Tax=Variovorax sp. LT1P1 TaxID=3443730 RepID=UPI003F45DDC7